MLPAIVQMKDGVFRLIVARRDDERLARPEGTAHRVDRRSTRPALLDTARPSAYTVRPFTHTCLIPTATSCGCSAWTTRRSAALCC